MLSAGRAQGQEDYAPDHQQPRCLYTNWDAIENLRQPEVGTAYGAVVAAAALSDVGHQETVVVEGWFHGSGYAATWRDSGDLDGV